MSSNAYVSLIRSIRWSMGLLYGILFHNPTLTRLKQIQLRQLVLSVRIANPWTVTASLKCSRTLNYRFLIRGESNWGSRLCSMWLRGWYQLYQPLNILKQFKINVKYVTHVIKTESTNIVSSHELKNSKCFINKRCSTTIYTKTLSFEQFTSGTWWMI